MTDASASELSELGTELERRLSTRLGEDVRICGLRALAGGACQESYSLDLLRADGSARRLVLRADASSSLPGSLRRADEFQVVAAAVAAGVCSPTPHWLLTDLLGRGRDAWLMDHVDGEALGRRVVHSPRYDRARAGLIDKVAANMAALRRLTPQLWPDLPLRDDVLQSGDPAISGLAFARRMLDALPTPQPALEAVHRWLSAHAPPPPDQLCLVHGDLRTGNLLIDEQGLVALLDYEFAHWGDPVEDMAWLCVRDWRFGRLDRAAGGFATRAQLLDAVERATGDRVSAERLHWWEVQGNLLWAAGALYQGERFLSGEVLDLELLAIPWRSAEMAFEALRLVAVGPHHSGTQPPAAGPALPCPPPPPTRPDEATVLRATALFLEQDLRHRVTDRAASFRARIAAHLLTVVATWQEVGPAVLRDDVAAWSMLLGDPLPATTPPTSLSTTHNRLRSELAAAIRADAVSLDQALPVLMARLRAELAVRSPSFAPDAAVD